MTQGCLFVISGPSGVGKTTVVNQILQKDASVARVITCTSRKIRPGEKSGEDYIFLTTGSFLKKIAAGDFAEFSEVYGNYYGVLIESIQESMKNQKISILNVNWEGFSKIKNVIGEKVYGVFLTPPSEEELENRLRSRATDSEEVIQRRLAEAKEDMSHASEYNFVVENKDIDKAVDDILKIFKEVSELENR